jgi:hypothetical protein
VLTLILLFMLAFIVSVTGAMRRAARRRHERERLAIREQREAHGPSDGMVLRRSPARRSARCWNR